MKMRCRFKPRASIAFLGCLVVFSWFPEFISAAVVTLESIEINKTHELFNTKPTVYFLCKGENKTILPDVKEKDVLYTFKGEESWQPLTELQDKKCKRCGLYVDHNVISDDVFDEWEFCASDFTRSDGKYIHFKDKEFNATFSCLECVPLGGDSVHSSGYQSNEKGMPWALVVAISVLVSTVFILGLVIAYKYWKKRKREQEQARFLKLFEDGDDIEDELDIGPLSNGI